MPRCRRPALLRRHSLLRVFEQCSPPFLHLMKLRKLRPHAEAGSSEWNTRMVGDSDPLILDGLQPPLSAVSAEGNSPITVFNALLAVAMIPGINSPHPGLRLLENSTCSISNQRRGGRAKIQIAVGSTPFEIAFGQLLPHHCECATSKYSP